MTPNITILSPGTFYTYLWLRDDGTTYYVGKGTWENRRKLTRQRAYREGKYSPKDSERVIVQDHPTELAAFEAEIFLISFYGRKDLGTGLLWNRTTGGDGSTGLKHSAESRKRISESRKGRIVSPETREKIRIAKLGVPQPLEVRRKMSESKRGKPIAHYDPVIHSERMSGKGNPMFGKKRLIDEQWRERLSEGKKGRVQSEETRRKMAEARRRRPYGVKPTHCYRGHEFTPENTWVGKSGSRFCLQCRHINHKAANLRNKQRREAARC